MCRTIHALLQVGICGVQMLVRVIMTVMLMIENLIRMILQTLYNFISFMMQMLSLLPICCVFLVTARLKCFMCGGGGPCPVNRGGTCDCLMSAMAIVILFLIFRATGVLEKIFYKIGYVKARPQAYTEYVPTPGDITECSRNESMSTAPPDRRRFRHEPHDRRMIGYDMLSTSTWIYTTSTEDTTVTTDTPDTPDTADTPDTPDTLTSPSTITPNIENLREGIESTNDLTTVMYFLA